jgi:hypothetical protein
VTAGGQVMGETHGCKYILAGVPTNGQHQFAATKGHIEGTGCPPGSVSLTLTVAQHWQ